MSWRLPAGLPGFYDGMEEDFFYCGDHYNRFALLVFWVLGGKKRKDAGSVSPAWSESKAEILSSMRLILDL